MNYNSWLRAVNKTYSIFYLEGFVHSSLRAIQNQKEIV